VSLYIQFLLIGIGTGVIIGALAIGLTLSYRASGVINFGHGAIATYITYVFVGMRDAGEYPIPPLPNPIALVYGVINWFGPDLDAPDIPTMIDVGEGTSIGVAVAVAMLTAVLLGLAAHFLVFRPLRYAPATAKVVASIGLLLTLQAIVVLRFGSRAKRAESLLPDEPVSVLGANIPRDRFLLLALLLVVTFVLWAVFRFTRFGLATRASAENEEIATLLGYSADFQAAVSWVVASLIAGGVGILVAPITGVTPSRLTLLIVPALAAALVGAFSSFWTSALVGLSIGMTQSLVFILEQRQDWVPDLDLAQVLPLLMIGAAMFFRGNAIPGRGATRAERLPLAYADPLRPWLITAAVLATFAAAIWLPFAYRNGLNNSMIGIILALSLVVVVGYVGQVSLAQVALQGVAAFGIGTYVAEAGVPFIVGFPLAIATAALFGLLVGVLALRSRGPSLAIVTLAAGIAIEAMLFRRDGWFGSSARAGVDTPSIFGFEFGSASEFFLGDDKQPSPAIGVLIVSVTVIACLFVALLRRSPTGEQMLAVRANERAAAAAGVDVARIKLVAFSLSAALAGAAGGLKASQLGSFQSGTFGFTASLVLIAYAYLGGISTVSGALWTGTLVGAGLGTVLGEEFIVIGKYEIYIAGTFLILELAFDAEGIAGSTRKFNRAVGERIGIITGRNDAASTSEVAA
jgi:branched-chain amino acid transport system permease protein